MILGQDGVRTNGGDEFGDSVANCCSLVGTTGPLVGVGVNCTAPYLVTPLLGKLLLTKLINQLKFNALSGSIG